MIWPFKKRDKKIRINVQAVSLVESFDDQRMRVVVCGVYKQDKQPLRLDLPRDPDEDISVGSPKHIILNADW
jgi:hypothetical protein